MAKLRSGILGNIRGKVAGVVGGQWKDVNYVREYVKPANPNTAAQQTQRTAMTDVVAFCKTLVGPVFNAYTDKFQKSMSGFNRFIKSNIDEFDGAVDYTALILTEGVLYPIQDVILEYVSPNVFATFTWDEAIGNNGALTDAVYAAVYDKLTGLWMFPAAETTRDDESMTVTVPATTVATNLEGYIWAAAKTGTIVNSISNSVHKEGTAP